MNFLKDINLEIFKKKTSSRLSGLFNNKKGTTLPPDYFGQSPEKKENLTPQNKDRKIKIQEPKQEPKTFHSLVKEIIKTNLKNKTGGMKIKPKKPTQPKKRKKRQNN